MGSRNQGQIGTLVERSTRYCMLVHLPDSREADIVADALTSTIKTLPAELMKSLTWDQGGAMASHQKVTLATDAAIYFCDPRKPVGLCTLSPCIAVRHHQFMIDDARTARFTAVLAQFTHPSFGRVATDLSTFERVLPGFSSRAELIEPGRLYLSERLPIGMIVALSLPTVSPEVYARHLAAVLIMGNLALVAPLTEAQRTIADRMRRALPGKVRLAGEDLSSSADLRVRLLVTLGHGDYRLDGGQAIPEGQGDAAHQTLCAHYSRPVAALAVVRASYLPVPSSTRLAGPVVAAADPGDRPMADATVHAAA